MSRLTQWLDHFFQQFVWKSFLSHFQGLDWVVFILLLAGMVYGIKKGFWKVLADILRLVIVLVMTFEYHMLIAQYLERFKMLPAAALSLLSFFMSAVLLWFVVSFFIRHLRKMFSAKTSVLVRVFGGSILGAVYSLALLSFISQMVFLSPSENFKKRYLENAPFMGRYLAGTAPAIHHTVMAPLKWLSRR